MEWICINKPDFAKSLRVNTVAYLIEILFLDSGVVICTSHFYSVDKIICFESSIVLLFVYVSRGRFTKDTSKLYN